MGRVLVCSVGTGNIDQLRESLFVPLAKSIRAGEWQRVVLLPSLVTATNAEQLRAELPDIAIGIRSLPEAGAEENADACFAHFDQVIAELRQEYAPHEILADFTRGTKAMSAALVLAAVRHELPQLRYVSGERRDARGMVVAGTEVVKDIRTTVATARRRLDEAREFLRRGNFAAVLDILPDPASPFSAAWPQELIQQASQARPMASFYGAWDRLDYKAAQQVSLPLEASLAPMWTEFLPSQPARDWVRGLAEELPEDAKERADRLRLLAVDLLANGERRLRDQQFEDAIIRAYRVLELVGQFRLCDQGIHSDDVPEQHPTVQAFQAELSKNKKGSAALTKGRKGGLLASRLQVARLLSRFNDPLAPSLLKIGDTALITDKGRNLSVLIHGFEVAKGHESTPIADQLAELFSKLEDLLITDAGEMAKSRLAQARSLDFSVRP